ncbi:hypothetical protein, partial [Enterococcus florum]|uniref:hypothetical protein n=1 Tax=Enterococcus florum TaxID=2480627 RepID=UPI0011BACA01
MNPIQRLKEKWPFLLFSFISLSVVFPQALHAYDLTTPSLVWGIIALLCLSLGFFQANGLKVIVCVLGYILGLYALLPLNRPLSVDWLLTLWQRMLLEYQQFFSGFNQFVSEICSDPKKLDFFWSGEIHSS